MALPTNITAGGPFAQEKAKNLTTHKFSTLISNSSTRMAKKKSFSTLDLSDQAFKGVIDGVKVLHSQHTSNERENAPTFLSNFSPT